MNLQNNPPTIRINTPNRYCTFQPGQILQFTATASDDHTPVESLKISWQGDLVHGSHWHPGLFEGKGTSISQDFSQYLSDDGGRYSILLTVTVTDENKLQSQDFIHCHPIDQTNVGPTAVISANPTTGPAYLTVFLTGVLSSDTDFDRLIYSWSLGDGTISNEANVIHTYTKPGEYAVTLSVRDTWGVISEDTATIIVKEPLTAHDGLCAPDYSPFITTPTATPSSSTESDPSHPQNNVDQISGSGGNYHLHNRLEITTVLGLLVLLYEVYLI